ncbi:MAG: hypothetical protein WAO98_07000 [Alphaproteobacteria bacterium]
MKQRISLGIKLGLPRHQAAQLAKLTSPEKVQDFINDIPINFEPGGDTCLSVTEVLRQRRAHCIEAAFTAACAFWINGSPPLVMDMQAKGDCDHVIAVFKHKGCWGAISKSNHVWLRWRDPVYRNLRELAMSYFHEYVSGQSKTLTAYSVACDLRRFDTKLWISNRDDCWDVAAALDGIRHYKLVTAQQAKNLRHRDSVEIRAGDILQYKAPNKKAAKMY